MPHQSAPQPFGIDVSLVEPAETRRSLRTALQQIELRFQEQQNEIEALIDMLCDRHAISVGEFKVYLRRTQQRDEKAARLHASLAQAAHLTPPQAPPAAPARVSPKPEPVDEEEASQRPKVYTL